MEQYPTLPEGVVEQGNDFFLQLHVQIYEQIAASDQVECTQVYRLRNESFGCAHLHGRVDMRRALIESCNFYFYRLGETIGLDRIAAMAMAFGLGEASGIGVNDEARGLIPTRAWYDARHIAWGTGYSVITAIGQGETRATVLQAAVAYAALANGGDLYTPYVVSEVRREDGTSVQTFGSRLRRHIPVAPEHLALVNDSLVGVVNNVDGTAYSARFPNGVVEVAGKTGTAEVTGRIRAGEQSRSATYSRRAHAWFAGFAPARAPEVAIAVLVEHGGSGGEAAAPIATAVLDTLFRLRMTAEPAAAPRP